MTSIQRQTFRRLFLINFLISLGFAVSDAFFPLYCENLGGRGLWLGIAVGSYALVKILFSPLMGRLSDRHGWQPLVFVSLLLFLLVSVSYALTDNLIVVISLRVLQGVGCAMFRPIVQTLISEQVPRLQRATLLGRFDSSFYAALCIGSVFGGVVWDIWSFPGLFACLFACCLSALMVAIPLFLRGSLKRGPKPAKTIPTDIKPVVPDIDYPGLLLFIFGRACGISACATFLPILLVSKLALSGFEIGIIMASSTLVMALLLRPAGKLADKVSRKSLILSGGVTVALFYLLLPLATGFIPVLLLTTGIGVGSAFSQPAASSLLAEQGTRLGLGTSIGTFHGVLNLGFVVGALLGATVQTLLGLHMVFVVVGLIGLVSLLGLLFPLSVPDLRPNRYSPPNKKRNHQPLLKVLTHEEIH